MEKWFNLNTDNTLGGEKSSDYVSPSQKAIKEYVDREIQEHASSYRYTKTLVVTDEESRTVYVSELYGGVEYTDSCIDVSSDGDTEIVVNALPLYKSVFVAVNTSEEETIGFGFDLSDLEYGILNCRSDCVTAFNRLSVPVLPLGARVVEFYLVGTMMSVRISDIHLDTYTYTPPDYLNFKARRAGSTVSMSSSLDTAPVLEYSLDGVHFTQWGNTLSEGVRVFDTITLAETDDTVWLRGNNPSGFASSASGSLKFSNFIFTGEVEAGGNVQTIADRLGESLQAVRMENLFSDGTDSGALLSAPSLPATTLSPRCYAGMFAGCTGLRESPALPASSLAGGCYEGMFTDCVFDMSDDCVSFSFSNGLQFPCGDGTDTFGTPRSMAEWMGNTNGFCDLYEKYMPYVFGGTGETCYLDTPCAVWGSGERLYAVCCVFGDFTGNDTLSLRIGDAVFPLDGAESYVNVVSGADVAYCRAEAAVHDCPALDERAGYIAHYEGREMAVAVAVSAPGATVPASGTAGFLVNGTVYAEMNYVMYDDYDDLQENLTCCDALAYAPEMCIDERCFAGAPAAAVATDDSVAVSAVVFGDFDDNTSFTVSAGGVPVSGVEAAVYSSSEFSDYIGGYEGLVDRTCFDSHVLPYKVLCELYPSAVFLTGTAAGLSADCTLSVYASGSAEAVASVPCKYYASGSLLETDTVCCNPVGFMPVSATPAAGCMVETPCLITPGETGSGSDASAVIFGDFSDTDTITLTVGNTVFTGSSFYAETVTAEVSNGYSESADVVSCEGENMYSIIGKVLGMHIGDTCLTCNWTSGTQVSGEGVATISVNGETFAEVPYKAFAGYPDDPDVVCCQSAMDYMAKLSDFEGCVWDTPGAAYPDGEGGSVVHVQVFGDYTQSGDFSMSIAGVPAVDVLDTMMLTVSSAVSAMSELHRAHGSCFDNNMTSLMMQLLLHGSDANARIFSLTGVFEGAVGEDGEVEVTMPGGRTATVPFTVYASEASFNSAATCCDYRKHMPRMWDGENCVWGTPATVTLDGGSYSVEFLLFGNISGQLSVAAGDTVFEVSAGEPSLVDSDFIAGVESNLQEYGFNHWVSNSIRDTVDAHRGENMYRVTGVSPTRPDTFKEITVSVGGVPYDSMPFTLYESESDRTEGAECYPPALI